MAGWRGPRQTSGQRPPWRRRMRCSHLPRQPSPSQPALAAVRFDHTQEIKTAFMKCFPMPGSRNA
eukprot:365123-Chlamydomonas_euryale.AAC.24